MKHYRPSKAGIPPELRYLLRYIVAFCIAMAVTIQVKAQVQEAIFPSLAGEELLGRVVDWYKPRIVLDYGLARDVMYSTIYKVLDSVECIYTGHTLHLPQGVDPSSHLFNNGSSNGINCEHTYPRSKGADDENGNAFSDMHHLFPAQSAVNIARSNLPFGEIDDNLADAWYYLDEVYSRKPASNIDAYSERAADLFEPREKYKGNIARAMFYFYTMYKNEALAADPNFFEVQREVLCNWHTLDPIDSLEWERTFMISQYQNGLENPFVLDSTLAPRAYCNLISGADELVEADTWVYPNPTKDLLNIRMIGTNELRILDLLGRTLISKNCRDGISLDVSHLQAGSYYVIAGGEVLKFVKL